MKYEYNLWTNIQSNHLQNQYTTLAHKRATWTTPNETQKPHYNIKTYSVYIKKALTGSYLILVIAPKAYQTCSEVCLLRFSVRGLVGHSWN